MPYILLAFDFLIRVYADLTNLTVTSPVEFLLPPRTSYRQVEEWYEGLGIHEVNYIALLLPHSRNDLVAIGAGPIRQDLIFPDNISPAFDQNRITAGAVGIFQ
jgi:hypothetical protein